MLNDLLALARFAIWFGAGLAAYFTVNAASPEAAPYALRGMISVAISMAALVLFDRYILRGITLTEELKGHPYAYVALLASIVLAASRS